MATKLKAPRATVNHRKPRVKSEDLRKQAAAYIEGFEYRESLELAVRFLAFLEDQECETITREVEAMPGMAEAMQQGLRDIAEGKTTPWEELRRKP